MVDENLEQDKRIFNHCSDILLKLQLLGLEDKLKGGKIDQDSFQSWVSYYRGIYRHMKMEDNYR